MASVAAERPQLDRLTMLHVFLREFCSSYERLCESSSRPVLQRVYGDLQPVLLRLVEFVREAFAKGISSLTPS